MQPTKKSTARNRPLWIMHHYLITSMRKTGRHSPARVDGRNGNLNFSRANGAHKSKETEDLLLDSAQKEGRNYENSVESCVAYPRFVSGCFKREYCAG